MQDNYTPADWKRFFAFYDQTSVDETGKVTTYSNAMEEIYQAFMTRRDHDKAEAAKKRLAMSKMEEATE